MQVHSIESLAALDGEGLRYDLFLAGCPLRCACCHNPDTWNPHTGKQMDQELLLKKILRYKPYFGTTGGVTFSGGEPLLQAAEIAELGEKLRREDIGYTLDTSGCLPLTQPVLDAVAGADMVICDLKYPNEELMQKWAGGPLQPTLDFLNHLVKTGKRTWVRTVIIPGINDSIEMLDEYLKILKPMGRAIEKYELLAFHTMGFFKYEELGIENPLKDFKPMSHDRLEDLQAYVDQERA